MSLSISDLQPSCGLLLVGVTKILLQIFAMRIEQPRKTDNVISGYSYHIGQGAVSWSSKKQKIFALKPNISLKPTLQEALWLRTCIRESLSLGLSVSGAQAVGSMLVNDSKWRPLDCCN
jgi:hypothetical protein